MKNNYIEVKAAKNRKHDINLYTSIIVVVFIYALSFFHGQSSFAQTSNFILPVEVLGEENLVETRTLELEQATATKANGLWLLVNNLGYEDKASIRVNNGSWTTLNHSTTTIQPQAMARGGMVHGGFSSFRLTLPITGFKAGENIIYFRFNKSDGISMGYRVVQFNIIDKDGNKLLSSSTFKKDDPSSWTAPDGYDNQASIDEGKDLWNNANLWNHYLPDGEKGFWYGQELPASRPMNAKCSSCHAQDGRDLELFSYSNKSIIERAKFHKLSEVDGNKIAAYIRSLSANEENVERHGRPWNPPYQPGPTLKDKPIEQWAAGAGLEAVLEDDKDMLPYLFPNGTGKEAIRNAFDADVMDDRTLLPLAIQFPDWKHWLPIIHPMDAYNKNDWWFSNLPDNRNPVKAYEEVRAWFETSFDPNNFPSGNTVPQKFIELWTGKDGNGGFRKFHEYNRDGCSVNHWRTQCGEAVKNLSDGIPQELANMSLARLMGVKNFELMTEFDLQDKQKLVVPDVLEDQPAERQWPSNTYSVFEIPPHFTATNSRHYQTQDERTGHYENTTWYNVQMVINGGNGISGGTTPVDFNYHHPFMLFASSTSGINEPLRYVSAVNHMYQIRTWSKSDQPNNAGFRIRFMGPWTMMGSSDSNQEFFNPSYDVIKQLDNIEPGLSDKTLEAMLLMFLEEVESYDAATWPRVSPHGKNYELDPMSKTTADLISIPHTGQPTGGRVTEHFADKMYDIIPRIKQNFNVHCSITNRMAEWCKAVWPNIDFEKFIEANCGQEACTSLRPSAKKNYRIRTAHNKCLSSLDYGGYDITQQACDFEDDKRWKLEAAGNGAYYLKNLGTENYLQSPDANLGSALVETAFNNQVNQQWLINEDENCGFTITSAASDFCIDLKSGSKANGTRMQQYTCSPVNENRLYKFEEMNDQNGLKVSIQKLSDGSEVGGNASFIISLDDDMINETEAPVTGHIKYAGSAIDGKDFIGIYRFEIASGQSQTVINLPIIDDEEVEGNETTIISTDSIQNATASSTNEITISIVDNDECTPLGDLTGKTFTIKTVHDKCVSGYTTSVVTQQTCMDSNDEKWTLEAGSNGYNFLKNVGTGSYLSATTSDNGSPLELNTFDGSDTQQWMISQKANCALEITSLLSDKCIDLKRGSENDGAILQQWECIEDVNVVNREFSLEEVSIITAIESSDVQKKTTIYPTLVNNHINLNLKGNTASVSIISSTGEIVKEETFKQNGRINLERLRKGPYIIQLKYNAGLDRYQFIKL